MIGNNSLTVCPALMIQIVQEWIDRNVASKPKVTQVAAEGRHDGFTVHLSETEQK